MKRALVRRFAIVAVLCTTAVSPIACSPPMTTLFKGLEGEPVALDLDAPVADRRIRAQLTGFLEHGQHFVSASAWAVTDDGEIDFGALPVTVGAWLELKGGGDGQQLVLAGSSDPLFSMTAFGRCVDPWACEEVIHLRFELNPDAGVSSAIVQSWSMESKVLVRDEKDAALRLDVL